MTGRRTLVTLAVLLGAAAVLTSVGFVLMVLSWPRPVTYAEWGFAGFQGSAAVVFAVVGAPVAWRRPSNPIGWLLVVAGLLSALQYAGHQYAIYGIITAPGSVPGAWIGTWIEEWVWVPIMAAMGIFPFFLFPTGRFISSRWQVAGLVALVGVAIATPASAFVPLARVPGAENPLARLVPTATTDLVLAFALVFVVPTLFVSWASVVVRFRRASGVERQQLKVLAFGGLIVAVGMTAYLVSALVTGDPYGPASAAVALALFAVPVAMGVAMLRYGLYEVDRLLNRAVVYGVVSTVLVAAYTISIIVLQGLLEPITTGDSMAVALSTLVVVTVFQPVRMRVQRVIDRRFFRSRYNAQASVQRLAIRLRDELEASAVAVAVIGEASRAVKPAGACLWLRRG